MTHQISGPHANSTVVAHFYRVRRAPLSSHHLHLISPPLPSVPCSSEPSTMNAVDKHSAPCTPLCNATADRGIKSNNPPRKRPRETPLSFLGDDFSSLLRQQTLEVNCLIVNHTEKVRAELLHRRRQFWRQALAAIEDVASKRLRAKDEEIEGITKMNSVLQERVRGLSVENKIWRELAQTNEAAAAVLRNNLEHAAAMQDLENEEPRTSCRGDNFEYDAGGCVRTVCCNCRDGEASGLPLPCYPQNLLN